MLDQNGRPEPIDWKAPRPGQPAFIVALTRNGPYFARFPFGPGQVADRATAYDAAHAYRDKKRPAARVFAFTGRVELVFEAGVSAGKGELPFAAKLEREA